MMGGVGLCCLELIKVCLLLFDFITTTKRPSFLGGIVPIGLVEALFSLSLNLVSSRSNLRNPLKISLKVANKSAFTNNSTEDPSPCGSLLSIYYHAYDLYHKTPSPTLSQLLVKTSGYPHKHQLLAEYSSWEEVKDVVREFGDDLEDEERQLSEVVAMEDELRERSFKEKLDRASGCVVGEDEDPDIILGVTHQVSLAFRTKKDVDKLTRGLG